MNYIGMDVHKRFTYAVVKDEQGNKIKEDKFDNSKENFKNFLQIFAPEETKIVMESTGVWEYIYNILEELGYSAKLANPVRTKAIAWAKVKTDAVDADTLADLLRANLVAESYVPTKTMRKLREVVRERKTFVKQITQIKNKIHAILTKRGFRLPTTTLCMKSEIILREEYYDNDVIVHYLNLLTIYRKEISEIEESIKNIVNMDHESKLLMTIPGIGCIRAIEIISEIGDVNRFSSSEKLCAYSGLVPSISQSGSSLKFGSLVKQSNRILKNAFIEASWTIVQKKETNFLQEFYKKLAKKKGKQKAICATARKLCSVTYAVLKNNEEFRY